MSWAIWVTGIPGSGKSVLARAAAMLLGARGERVRLLELDVIRKTLTPRPRYSPAERDVVYRALVYMARQLTDVGVPVIIDATAHRRLWRDLARAAMPAFGEVQVVCPPAIARERERTRTEGHAPTGIYARAGRPGATVPGVDVAYEPALAPELAIDSATESVADAAARIADLAAVLARAYVARAGREPAEASAASAGWTIWITGRPGSGKSSITARVAATLGSQGVCVRVLDVSSAHDAMLPDRTGAEADHEIVHRAIAYVAKLLTDGGAAVIVDGTAPRRAWRDAARELIASFAEVQLVCPADVCVERERSVRWGLGGDRRPLGAPPPDPAPDLALDYEESLRPDLVLRTDAEDPSTAARQVLFLAQRLQMTNAVVADSP